MKRMKKVTYMYIYLCKTLKNEQIFRIHTINYIIYSINMK